MKPETELARVCAILGTEIPLWTQANGGNVSVKISDRLWIKASGFRLDKITETKGLARLSSPFLLENMKRIPSAENGDAATDEAYFSAVKQSAERDGSLLQPSMESGFHAVLRHRWVMHLHSLAGIILARSEHSGYVSDLAKKMGHRITVIPEMAPGLELAQCLEKDPDSRIYLLENHGVILQEDETPRLAGGVLQVWREVERRVRPLLRPASILHKQLLGNSPIDFPRLLRDIPAAPWRIYFPDAAVFQDRVLSILKKVDTKMGEAVYSLAAESSTETNRDAIEIVAATFLLHDACPLLEQLPAKRIAQLRGMAFEKHRKEIAA